MHSPAAAKSLSAFVIHSCATSPLFFIENFAFAQRLGFNGQTRAGPFFNFFRCTDEDLFVDTKTKIGQSAVDWDRVLRSWLGRFVRDDEQIDIAVASVSAPGATAEKDDFLWIRCFDDAIHDLLHELGRELGQVSWNPAREHADVVRVAQSPEELIAAVANIFADLDEVPKGPICIARGCNWPRAPSDSFAAHIFSHLSRFCPVTSRTRIDSLACFVARTD